MATRNPANQLSMVVLSHYLYRVSSYISAGAGFLLDELRPYIVTMPSLRPRILNT